MIPRPKYIANKMPRHIIIFLLLIIYINVICIHQIYADGISMTSRNIHMNSIVENKNDFNRLKAEEINTKAMEIEATSVKDALQLLLEAYKLDPTNWIQNNFVIILIMIILLIINIIYIYVYKLYIN